MDLNVAKLGTGLRVLRNARGWTLEEVAQRTALSKSYLSRLEEGERQPSIAALLTLARAYEVSLASLLEPPEHETAHCVVVRGDSAPTHEGNGLLYTPLSTSARSVSMQPIRVTVPAVRKAETLYRHDGEEWLYVLSGTLELTLAEETYALRAGDAAHFDARVPHCLAALNDQDAELILVACAAPIGLLDSYRRP